jgi:hypothetical protein
MNQGKKEESDRHHEHNRTTGMLLAVVVLFLITELPQGILNLLIIFIPELQHDVYNNIGDVLDIVALCNNAINFVLYCSMSKQFRDTFVHIFCKCCPNGITVLLYTNIWQFMQFLPIYIHVSYTYVALLDL